MCGILGFITEQVSEGSLERSRFMSDGLIMDTLRGDDATGVFMVPHAWAANVKQEDKTAYTLKDAVPGHTFVSAPAYGKLVYPMKDWRAAVGHNRAATRGKRDANNAHPFQEGPVTLVHNGTLTTTYGLPVDQWDLNKGVKEEDKISVDSHVICHNLALKEPDAAPDVISYLRGAFALVWHDARDESVNIIRNGQRPLHLAYDKEGKTLFFMSEHEMLYAVAKRNKIVLSNVFYPKPGIWMKWLPDTPLKKPIVKEVELGKYTPSYSGGSGFRGWGYDEEWRQQYSHYGERGYYHQGKWYRRSNEQAGTQTPAQTPATASPPATPAVASGKAPAAAPSADNRVMLLGRRREVPQYHQDMMYLYDLTVDDRLPFLPHVPQIDLPKKGRKAFAVMAEGCLYGSSYGRMSAVVHGVPDHTYRQALDVKINDRIMWTVRPVGISWLRAENGVERPMAICRLVRPWYDERNSRPAPDNDEVTELPLDRFVGGAKVEEGTVMYPGPGGIFVTKETWDELVKDGCAVCYNPLSLIDAPTIEWVENYPVCNGCQDEEELGDDVVVENF